MKKTSYVIPHSLALTTAIVYVACRILVGLFPGAFFAISQSWFHGIKLNRLESWSLTGSSFIIGLISSTVTAWVIGWLFVKVYRWLDR